MPRTAGSFLFDLLRTAYMHNERDRKDPRAAGEWSQTDNWVILAHEPLLFRSAIPDVTMTTVLRNPIDAISSQILKSSYGFSPKTIAGRPEIVDGNIAFLRDNKEEHLQESLYQECRMWEGYTYGATISIDSIVPFTFEQVTQDTEEVLSSIYSLSGGSSNYRQMTKDDIAAHTENNLIYLNQNIVQTTGAANALPAEKPQEYYIIREAVEKYHMLPKLLDDYEKAKEAFCKRHKDLGILQDYSF